MKNLKSFNKIILLKCFYEIVQQIESLHSRDSRASFNLASSGFNC